MKKILDISTPSLLLITILVISRIIPHIPNIAPIAAMSLFAGAKLPFRYAVIIPLGAMAVSDYFLGYHSTMLFVYGSFLVIAYIGRLMRSNKSPWKIIGASLISSLLFFIVTNLGVFLAGDIYPRTVAGLVECYLAALPFFRNTIIGDVVYTGVFFGGYELLQRIDLKTMLSLRKIG
jgi:hypothetical protein